MKTSNDFNFHERTEYAEDFQGSSDRVFGLVFSAFWSVVGLAPLTKGSPTRVWAVVLAAAFLVISLIMPTLLGPLNQLWQRFGRLLRKVTNPIVMAILFFSTVVPFGVIMRLLKRDVLRLEWERESVTYWIPRNPPGPRPDSMKDQF
jgi:saxitoxin biosynthesis operon SxtJ-like protein